jgi:hypothetical protein
LISSFPSLTYFPLVRRLHLLLASPSKPLLDHLAASVCHYQSRYIADEMWISTASLLLQAGHLSLALASAINNPPLYDDYCSLHSNNEACKTNEPVRVLPPTKPTKSPKAVQVKPLICPKGKFEITSFTWFNSSHNLNCPRSPDPDCLCCTGRPLQPPGYGPPDYVQFRVRNVATDRSSQCIYQNPGAIPISGDPASPGIKKCSIGDQTFIFSFSAVQKNNKGGSKCADLTITDRTVGCK